MSSTSPPSQTFPKSLPEGYALIPSPPPVPVYLNLRLTTGLTPKSAPQATKALAGSWYTIHITYSPPSTSTTPEIVAQARVIGDGGWYFHIADVAVLPSHQRKEIADFMMQHLICKIEGEMEGVGRPYINLVADPPANRLYERHGFVETSSVGRRGVGMQRY